ncbi:MAG: type I-C CRISPR-associated protein Cas5c [Acidobacteriota bacterium]
MAFGVKLEVWGEFAAFNRPEMKVERVSYDVMTPSAARGILEAIYWKPEMRWVVDAIHVLRPIRFTSVRRNEVSTKIPVKGPAGAQKAMKEGRGALGISVQDVRQQRAAMVLRDVRYGISAHVEVLESGPGPSPEAKHLEMFKRRTTRGQFFHHPYLGVREFPAFFRLVDDFPRTPEELQGQRDLGFMLHDIEFVESEDGEVIESHRGHRVKATPRFFRALLRDGVLDVPSLSDARA